ncbi:MAG: metalloregulator ArsR/SmtB family transcription factor [Parvularculaceae bacterium]|nr:helix-turn-helix transcriptional regulator [Parvularculaceae bacterium]
MPGRNLLARELSVMLKAIAHPDRIRIIEELKADELDVSALSERLGVTATRVSQHLALLKLHRLVEERREGRYHFYSLADHEFAEWILDGVPFIQRRVESDIAAQQMIEAANKLWRGDTAEQPN